MSTQTEDLRKELEDLKASQAAQGATQAGSMATMGAMQAGTVGSVAAGAVGLVIGMFLGRAFSNGQEKGRWHR
ncbi:MAG TPA: hypothetical protein VF108_01340 [Actinomycetota bacterium]